MATLGTIGIVKMTPYKFSQFPKYILKRPWFLKPNSLRLYIYLLLEANYQDNYKSNNITLLKDQLLTSNDALTKALKLTTGQIRTALKHLQETNDIEIKTTNKYSIITLLFEGKEKTGDEALVGLTPQEDKKQKGQANSKKGKEKTGDEALVGGDASKIGAKTRAISKEEEEDNNNNIYGDDFKEFYNNYPVQKTKVKGDEASSEKKYNSLRKNGVSKEELSNALANYKEEIKAKSWQQTKRVEGWLEEWETYKQEDYSKEIKEIKAKIIEIEPEATITADNKRINIVLPTFDKLLDCKTSIKNVIKPLCDNIGYQYYLQSNDNSNQL